MTYETHGGVTLKRVRVTRDVTFTWGSLKAQAGAIGLLASEESDGSVVTFEYHENPGLFIAQDGSGRKSQFIPKTALEDA